MPMIIDYAVVLERLGAQGLKCLYHNSGAFGFSHDFATTTRGFIGPEDGSIRESMMAMVRRVEPPFAERLYAVFRDVHQNCLPGPVWAMPKSHWAYELEFGSREWMPQLLRTIGLDPAALAGLNNAAAIEFGDDETLLLETFARSLLEQWTGSDFHDRFPWSKNDLHDSQSCAVVVDDHRSFDRRRVR